MSRALVGVSVGVLAAVAALPGPALGASCSDYRNQAEAQRAADTRDADGDGVYCESLPCPCSSAGAGSGGKQRPKQRSHRRRACTKPRAVVRLVFSKRRYPNIRRHTLDAIERGWPRILVVNRRGADARRDRLLDGIPTRAGFDRDEYPPAVGRGRGPRSLRRGVNPVGWMADVAYVPSRENQSHGSSLGGKLRRYCDGTRFRYVFG